MNERYTSYGRSQEQGAAGRVVSLLCGNCEWRMLPHEFMSGPPSSNTGSAEPVMAASDRPLTINLGLGKSGTTSLHRFFMCNGWRSSHYNGCNARSFTGKPLRGHLCADAVMTFLHSTWQDMLRHVPRTNEELFRNATAWPTRRFDAYSQIDDGITCNLPQVFHLRPLMSQLPKACFVLTVRPIDKWVISNANHKVGLYSNLLRQLVDLCPIWPQNATGVARLYQDFLDRATKAIEDWVRKGRCGVVVQTEDANAGKQLAAAFPGTKSECWQAANVLNTSTHRHMKIQQLRLACQDVSSPEWCHAHQHHCTSISMLGRCNQTCRQC